MTAALSTLESLPAVSLSELDAAVPLRVRADHKHLVDVRLLDQLLVGLAATHRALELDGRRTFAYDSVYFDTSDLQTARAHVQRRRQRFKARSRLYVDSDTCAFELKLKGRRGETVKHRMPYDSAAHGTLTDDALAFLGEHVRDVPDLRPALRTTYTRTTLAAADERVTIDLGLSYGAAWLRPQWAVVETKSARGAGIADRVLRRLGSRPLAMSKYLLGAGMTLMPIPPADTRLLAKRYFAHA
jgi:hypothetical protein